MKAWFQPLGNASGGYQSVASSIGQAVNSGAAAVKAAVKAERTSLSTDRQHVRLSVESARRLRWFENGDLSALVRKHIDEKQAVMACVGAMRNFVVQKGFEEADVDAEVQALLANVQHIKDIDDGVASVLLISAQDEVEHLRRQLARSHNGGLHHPHTPPHAHDHTLPSPHSRHLLVHVHLDCTTSNDPTRPVQLSITPCTPRTSSSAPAASVRTHADQLQSLVNRLQTISNDLISLKPSIMAAKLSTSGSMSAGAGTPTAAASISTSAEQLHIITSPGYSAATPGTPSRASPKARTPRQSMATASPRVSGDSPAAAPLPRIRTAQSASAAELGSVGSTRAPSTPGGPTSRGGVRPCEPQNLRPMVVQLAELESQRRDCLEAITDATAELLQAADAADGCGSKASRRVRELETTVAQLRSELHAAGGTAGAASRAAPGASPGHGGGEQLHAQLKLARNMVLEAEERACVAERRVEMLEGRCQKLQAAADACEDRMRAAEVRAADAQAAMRRRTAPAAADASAAPADRNTASAALRAAQREAATAAAAAAAAEAREAAALAQVAAMEEAAEEHGRLVAQVAALQGRADDSAAEQSRTAHFQKVAEELEVKVEQLSHEASRSARAIADADARAASAHATMMQALQEQKTAEDRAAAAEARVNDAVALRLRSMGADRTQWPEVARKGVEEAEHAAAAAAARAREVEGQLDAVKREVEENAAQQARWRECVADRDRDVEAARAEARLVQASLEQQLRRVESELTACQDARRRLEVAAATAAAPAPSPRPLPNGHRRNGAGGAAAAPGVRESLSLDDLHRASGAGESGGGAGGKANTPYVRGVVMKLLGAIAEGRASDRDALLPVVGMLLGASPQDCEKLQQAFNGSTLYEMLGYK